MTDGTKTAGPRHNRLKSRREVSMQYVRFLAAFVVYTVIDVGWNASPIARGMYESLYEASGNDAPLEPFRYAASKTRPHSDLTKKN